MTDHADPTLSIEEKAALLSGASTWTTETAGDTLPTLFLSDGPHGLRRQGTSGDNLGLGKSEPAVCFPPSAGLGSSWNPALAERVGQALGREARALDVQVLLGPGMNIKRSPLGGRNFEYYSEDPHLTGVLAAAIVRGVQSMGIAATPKHFAVNNQETDRMRVNATLSERALREIYLAAFEHVVTESDPWALMSSYNRVGGEYASESTRLLTTILREEWGFDGLTMSDWGAVDDPALAAAAGLDLEMPNSNRAHLVAEAVREGRLPEAVLDAAIARLRQLIERTTGHGPLERDIEASLATALDAARESIVLLKNDGVLPLTAGSAKRIAVIGEFARTPRIQGGGSSRVVPTRTISALDALQEHASPDTVIEFAPGFALSGEADAALVREAVEVASNSDVVLAFLGLSERAESEGFDRTTLALPADQLALLDELAATGNPIVVVLSNGAIVEVSSWRDRVSGIVEAWLLGQEGGAAIVEILFGTIDPSGRLTETIPHRIEDTSAYPTFPGRDGESFYGEDIYVGYRAYDSRGTDVAYPFGFGLSYTSFAYESMTVTATGTNTWNVDVVVRNTGARRGTEVVQLYIAAQTPEVARPSHELGDFVKISLEAGESKTVSLTVTPRALSFWNTRAARWQITPGDYVIELGSSSRDIHLRETVHSEGDGIVDPLQLDSTVAEWSTNPFGAMAMAAMASAIPAEISERAPELLRMMQETPVIKLTAMTDRLTADAVRAIVTESGGRA